MAKTTLPRKRGVSKMVVEDSLDPIPGGEHHGEGATPRGGPGAHVAGNPTGDTTRGKQVITHDSLIWKTNMVLKRLLNTVGFSGLVKWINGHH